MLYQRIKDFREDKDLTQTQMAKFSVYLSLPILVMN